MNDREIMQTALINSSFDEGETCPTCDGDGRVPSQHRSIHTMMGSFGASHDLRSALDDLATADEAYWVNEDSMFVALGHNLIIVKDGRKTTYQTKRPVDA